MTMLKLRVLAAALATLLAAPVARAATSATATATASVTSPAPAPAPATAPATALATATAPAIAPAPPPLLPGLGTWHHPISTHDALTQRYFDQGLRLVYAFNHDEAIRSFRAAAQRDPHCAMCLWGIALALGPNINMPGANPDQEKEALTALEKARAIQDTPSNEKAYVAALSTRYAPPPSDRAQLDAAYATAMQSLAKQYPKDVDAQVLAAEARMDLRPWRLWNSDGSPAPGTEEIVSTLQAALKTHPRHPGANHYLIHALEASPHPEHALVAAQRLPTLMPGAGHIVHMPAHIYMRTGQYDLAVKANEQAIRVDRAYLAGPHAEGMYATMYVAHNFQFLWAAAAMEGSSKKSIGAADGLAARFPQPVLTMMVQTMPGMDYFVAPPVMARIRFGKWNELLALPDPGGKEPYLQAMWHYGRAIAFAAKHDAGKAREEQKAFDRFVAGVPADAALGPLNSAREIMAVAQPSLAGEIALRTVSAEAAIPELQKAVKAEDALGYDEPPPWFLSPRQELGRALLEAKRPSEAEAVYRADLERYRENGWSLFGLREALRAQKKPTADVTRRFERAWAHADVKLTASTF